MFSGAPLVSNQLPKAQFRAVVLCGYGADLFPLIEPTASSASSDEDGAAQHQPPPPAQVKALLPVAGRRMIDWVLERIEAAGVFDILVLSPASVASPISHHVRARRASASASMSSAPIAKVELEEVPEDVTRTGTVSVLRWAISKDMLKTDFIILPCDLLLSPTAGTNPSISLASLIDRHRADDCLLTTMFYERNAGGVVDATKEGPSEVLTIYDSKTSTLLDISEMDKYDEAEEVPLRTSLLSRFPSPTLSTSLLPSQIYVISSSLIPLLTSPSHLRRLRHMEDLRELVGWICRLAWRKGGKEAVNYRPPSSIIPGDGIAMGRSTTQLPLGLARKEAGSTGRVESTPQTGANTPALTSQRTMGTDPWDAVRVLSEANSTKKSGMGGCKVVVWRVADGWCGRGNTVPGWVELNRAAIKLLPPSSTPSNTPAGVFISPDSFLNPTVYGNLGEKVGLKRCIIGKGCFIGKGSKLTNVIAMDNVVIGENVKLDNCVLSNGVQIRDRAILKDCELGRDVIVDLDVQLKNEKLVKEEED